ncbi:MAG: hypothetical protein KF823_00505 [Xanthomonadales bacterium]|nr:hypothetical protein [Xanthomonadales bacterium]
MKTVVSLTLFSLLFAALFFQLPRMLVNPSEGLMSNILNKDVVWGPLRKARIGLYIHFGASPDDSPYAGNSILETAVIYKDQYFIEKYADISEDSTLAKSMSIACVSKNEEAIYALRTIILERGMVPECPSRGLESSYQ